MRGQTFNGRSSAANRSQNPPTLSQFGPMELPPLPYGLHRITSLIEEFSAPSVAFDLRRDDDGTLGGSRLGGQPDLSLDFQWPMNRDEPLDFLLQVNLRDVAMHDNASLLPADGMLTFFYDLKEQPWGYDPANLKGFRVTYTPPKVPLKTFQIPRPDCALDQHKMHFHADLTIPSMWSRPFDKLNDRAKLSEADSSAYSEYFFSLHRSPRHHLLGHSDNIQGDMQLKAQLVTNGLYCGDPSGYNHPRRAVLEPGADDWMLLLQLDSDDDAGFMWGDSGMLYYWIRKQDLARRIFDNVWMTMQCC
jgi:uncharacterized protein YwqG